MICPEPRSRAICNNLVPLVVVNTRVLPPIKAFEYSKGEFPYSSPSAILPSRSPAVTASIFFPSSIHLATLSTGIIHLAPLYRAVAMVDVARNTSMITTRVLLISYKSSNAGDGDVYRVGLLFGIIQVNRKNRKINGQLTMGNRQKYHREHSN